MTNGFMKEFKKRLIRGLIVGGSILLLMILSPLYSEQSAFSSIPWYLIPVVGVITLLYGTGWSFCFNLIKRSWRKLLRVDRNAAIWQALTGHGIWIGLFYSMVCFVVGCFLSFVVGNYFMVRDYILAKKGEPPVSVKYKFDSDLEYDEWASVIRSAVTYSDNANGADSIQRFNNEINLRNIENGYVGVVTTDIKDRDVNIKRKTIVL